MLIDMVKNEDDTILYIDIFILSTIVISTIKY